MDDHSETRVGRNPLRWLALGAVLALVLGLSAVLVLDRSDSASAANLAINQCNGVSNAGGLTVECSVVVVNTLTDSAGTTGSVVTINGGAPTASGDLVTSVNQCNGSGGGGGGTVHCTVSITNNISMNAPSAAVAATVNQCNDNQASDGLSNAPNTCDPFPASTSGATITQCDGTGNGGGLVTVNPLYSHCTATGGTVSASLPVTVNQCNGSANGGGAQVSCTVTMTTNVTDTGGTTLPTTPPTTAPGGGTTLPTTPPTTAPGGTTPPTTAPGGTTPPTTAPGGTTLPTTAIGGTTPTTTAIGTTVTTTPGSSIDLTQTGAPPQFTG